MRQLADHIVERRVAFLDHTLLATKSMLLFIVVKSMEKRRGARMMKGNVYMKFISALSFSFLLSVQLYILKCFFNNVVAISIPNSTSGGHFLTIPTSNSVTRRRLAAVSNPHRTS